MTPSESGSAECLHCGKRFWPRRRGHVFCSRACRHKGERPLRERMEIDPEQVKRLFDPDRDPEERIREDDWFAGPRTPNGEPSMPRRASALGAAGT